MGEIERKDYETITARCDECGSLSVLNRVDDIGDPGPYYSGCYVGCTECGTPFWVFGDAIEPAYELLLLDAEEHMRAKQYMLCVMSLAQAWEMFFATFAYSHYLYRPFHRNARYPGRTERFDGLAKQLGDAIWNFTFHPLRNVLLNTVVEGVRPRTLDESEIAIARIRGDNFDQRPTKAPTKTLTGPADGKSKSAATKSGSCTGRRVGWRCAHSTSGGWPRARRDGSCGDRRTLTALVSKSVSGVPDPEAV